MTKSKLAIVGIILVLIGYGAGRYAQPAKIEYKTQTVVKEVEVVKKDIKTVVKTIRHKDGTVERVRTTEDKTVTDINKNTKSMTEKIIESKKLDWNVGAMVAIKDSQPAYGAIIQRRIIGTGYLGVFTIPSIIPVGVVGTFSF